MLHNNIVRKDLNFLQADVDKEVREDSDTKDIIQMTNFHLKSEPRKGQ